MHKLNSESWNNLIYAFQKASSTFWKTHVEILKNEAVFKKTGIDDRNIDRWKNDTKELAGMFFFK